jgi:hypothetical protein
MKSYNIRKLVKQEQILKAQPSMNLVQRATQRVNANNQRLRKRSVSKTIHIGTNTYKKV